MTFNELGFEPQLQEGLDMMGFEKPTLYKSRLFPPSLITKI